jgi:prevent-host-death family protein
MQFVPVRDFRIKPGEVWKKLEKEDNLIITSNGRPKALMIKINEDTLDESITVLRRAKSIMALERLHRTSVSTGLSKMTPREIGEEIKGARRAE